MTGVAFWMLNSSIPALEAIFTPSLNYINNSITVEASHSTDFAPNIYESWKVYCPAGAVTMTDTQLGSRLLDEKALATPLPELANGFQTAYPKLVLLGNLVSDPVIWNSKPAGGLGLMTPACRKAVVRVHLSMVTPKSRARPVTDFRPGAGAPVTCNFFNSKLKAEQKALLTNIYVASLRELAPDFGCYLNEADVYEPDLPRAYWGDNYAPLLNIKHWYNPHNVFNALHVWAVRTGSL